MHSIGIDVGGTKVLAIRLDPDHPLDFDGGDRVPTPEGGEGLVEVMAELADRVDPEATSIGVGVPGLVDRHGRLVMGPHLRKLNNIDLTGLLREQTGRSTIIV